MKIKIFVSYCHADIKPDDGRLEILMDALEAAGKGTFELLVDTRHQKASVGASLPAFFREIDQADVVVILLTPGYKQRVESRGDTGVYKEFTRIYNRLLQAEENNTYGSTYLILPIVFTNDFETSCPESIRSRISADLTWLHVSPQGRSPRLHREQRLKLKNAVENFAERINAVAKTKAADYRERQEKLFRDFLFHDTKSRWDKPENYRYLESAFVKTSTFLRARDRQISFLVGRKGSGKSTITHVLGVLSVPRPAVSMRIEFEDVPFGMCYNVLRTRPAEASDLRNAFNPLYSYQLFWDLFLHLFFAWQVKDRLAPNSKLRRLLNRAFAGAAWDENNQAEDSIVATRTLFVFAFENLANYIEEVMRATSKEKGLAGAMSRFTPSGLRRYCLGKAGWKYLERIMQAFKTAQERALITADGFDVMVGYFADSSKDRLSASQFEKELLLSLFQIVLNKGPGRVIGGTLYDLSDFLIAIPHDRFLQIRSQDRDRYQYRNRFARIIWSGIELSALVRKRLALLRDISDDKGPALEARLAAVLREGYPELPSEVAFQFGDANYRIPLYIYILRHTFWRPRDILFYYSSLLAASEEFQKKKIVMSSGFTRQIISAATRLVVEDEFIQEFSETIRNLEEILAAFRHGPQVLSWEELKDRIGGLVFDMSLSSVPEGSMEWKVELLYEMGIVGIVLDRVTSSKVSAFRHAFIFNEDNLLTEKIGRDRYDMFKFALHPVLCEYLNLDTSSNEELILPLDWQYLHRNEVLRGIAPPQ